VTLKITWLHLIWARMSGVVIWYEHECPGWSFDVSTNVRGGLLMWARMSGPVKNRVGTNVRGNECPGFIKNSTEIPVVTSYSVSFWVIFHIIWKNKIILNMKEPLFMFQLIIAVDVSEHRSGDFKSSWWVFFLPNSHWIYSPAFYSLISPGGTFIWH